MKSSSDIKECYDNTNFVCGIIAILAISVFCIFDYHSNQSSSVIKYLYNVFTIFEGGVFVMYKEFCTNPLQFCLFVILCVFLFNYIVTTLFRRKK